MAGHTLLSARNKNQTRRSRLLPMLTVRRGDRQTDRHQLGEHRTTTEGLGAS